MTLLNSKQGLSNSCTNSIYEDSRHNIWLCTQNGLNRYDGVKLNVYYHNDDDPTTLLNDEVTCVYEYDRNNIIVATGSGIQIYDYKTDKFQSLPFIGIDNDTILARFSTINSINYKGKRRIFACFTGYGTAELTRNSRGEFSLKHIIEFNTKECRNPKSIYQDKKNRIWIVENSGSVLLYNEKKTKKIEGINNSIQMCETEKNLYLATSYEGLYVYNESTKRFDIVASPSELKGTIYNITPWGNNRLFVCTDGGGLRIYNENSKKITDSPIKINNFDLSTSNVKYAMSDSYDNVWASIYWLGVMVKGHNQSAFDYVGSNSITKNTIGTNSVFAISAADKNNIWVAPDNDGLYLVSNDGSHSTHYSKDTNANMPMAFTTIYSMPDASGKKTLDSNVLLGTYTNGLWQYSKGTFSHITSDINFIFDIQPADNGNVWIATMGNGIYYYNPTTKQHIRYVSDWTKGTKGTDIIANPFVYCILQSKNNLFFGTADGLQISKYEGNGILKNKSDIMFRNIAVKHIAISDDNKYVWAATTRGLYKVDIKTKKFKRYTTSDGLTNNSVKALYVAEDNLWIATDNGLSCFDTKTEKFTNFFAGDGIQDNEFNRGTILLNNGRLFIGGIGGITYFNPSSIIEHKTEKNLLKVRLVDVLIGGITIHSEDSTRNYSILEDVLDDCEKITLSHKDNHFILELCVEGVTNQHFMFEYSMNGGDWSNQGYGSRLVFDKLVAGTHEIRIRAKSFDAVSEERVLTVHVKPIWYASWWAKLIYLLLILLISYFVHNYKKRQEEARQLIAKHKQQEEINEARIQFFMNLSHEIRTPMTLILAPLEKLLRMDKDAECQRNYKLIQQNANRILRLINQMMDVRKIEQGKYELNYQEVDIVALLQNTFEVFTNQAENRNIKYSFKHDDISYLKTKVDPENVDKMLMNLLSNSFKFTPDGGEIVMKLYHPKTEEGNINDNIFVMSVSDSGVGIKEEDKKKVFERFYSASHKNGYIGTGIGLNLTAMLVELHHGVIEVQDNPSGQGTEFKISIPINGAKTEYASPEVEKVENEETNQEIIPSDAMNLIDHSNEKIELKEQTEMDKSFATLVLVEDDASIRQYVHSEMSTDFNVIDFGDGQQAWEYVIGHSNEISLIISDIMMPVMDGLTLCQKVKSNFNTNHIPVLLMTALGSDEDRIIGITNGADAYMSKPFNIDVLRSTVIGLLRNRQLIQGKFKAEQLHEESIEKVELESPDENLMRRIMKVINDNLDNDELSVEMIADMVGISRVHFYRKMKDLTGQSPREFVKYVRLKEAARLLSTKKMDISSVSIACGFKSPSSFSTYFKALYGLSPSEWVKKQANENQGSK